MSYSDDSWIGYFAIACFCAYIGLKLKGIL